MDIAAFMDRRYEPLEHAAEQRVAATVQRSREAAATFLLHNPCWLELYRSRDGEGGRFEKRYLTSTTGGHGIPLKVISPLSNAAAARRLFPGHAPSRLGLAALAEVAPDEVIGHQPLAAAYMREVFEIYDLATRRLADGLLGHLLNTVCTVAESRQDVGDLFNEGYAFLLRAANGFRPGTGAKFISYVSILPAELRKARKRMRGGVGTVSLDRLSEDGWEPGYEQEFREAEQPGALLEVAIAGLGDREAYIIMQRYGEERTLQALADEFGLSRERIRQIEKRALERLRRTLMARGVTRAEHS